jgi:hypothetical protein
MWFQVPEGAMRTATRIASPDRCDRFYDFQQKTRAVLDGTTVGVGTPVTAVLKKLVW